MSLVVEARKAMETLDKVNDQLALIGNAEKLKGLTDAFDKISNTLVKARQFSEELDNQMNKTFGNMASKASDSQKQIANSVESSSKKISAAIDKNAHDMGSLLKLQNELAKSASILGREFKEMGNATLSTPKIDKAKAEAELYSLEEMYVKHYDKIANIFDRYTDNVDKHAARYKSDAKDKSHKKGDLIYEGKGEFAEPKIDFESWYNNKNLERAMTALTNYQLRMAELEKAMGKTKDAKAHIEALRDDLKTLNYIVDPKTDASYKGTPAQALAERIAKTEAELFPKVSKEVKASNKEALSKFKADMTAEQKKVKAEIRQSVEKLLGADEVSLDKEQKSYATKLTNQILERMTLGQKLRQMSTKASLEEKEAAEKIATDLQASTVKLSESLFNKGYHNAGMTMVDASIEDLEKMKADIGNKTKLLEELRVKKQSFVKAFNEMNKNKALELEPEKQKKTKKEDTQATPQQDKAKKEQAKQPEQVMSEFAQKIAEAKLKTLDLSHEFGQVAQAIPVERAEALVKTIDEAKKSLVQTLNAMVKATENSTVKADTKADKPKRKQKKVEVDPQVKEASKELDKASQNWEKVNDALPAPAISEAAHSAQLLETSLLAISKMKFTDLKNAMSTVAKTSKALVKAAAEESKSKTEKKQESQAKEQEAKAKTLIQERAQLIASLEERYSKSPNVTKSNSWKQDIAQLGELTQKIVQMRMELGQVNAVTGDFKQALALATNPQVFQAITRQMDIFFASLEKVNEAIRTAKANTPMAKEARLTKSQSDADAAWDALERQKLNQIDKMWKDYSKTRQTEQEKLNKASEKQVKLYHDLRDIEDKNHIKLIDAEQTESLKEAQKLLKEYLQLREKLNNSLTDNRAMSKSQYQRNTAREQKLISDLKDKGVSVDQNYISSYKEYAEGIKKVKDEEKAILDAQKKQAEESRKRLKAISDIIAKVRELRSILNLYKGESGDIMSLTNFNSKVRQITELMDRLYALTGERGFVKNLRDSELENLNGVNVAKKTKDVSDLKSQISVAAERAEKLYYQFEKTGTAADKIRFQKAVADLELLNEQEQKMNKALGRNVNLAQKFLNILKVRGGWILGGMTAGLSMSLPTELANSYREMEQAMAGVQQVMPLIEGKQGEVNEEALRFIGIAKEYARGVEEVVEAGRLWGRGYGKLSNDSEIESTVKTLGAQGNSISNLSQQEKEYVRDAQAMATTNELVRQSAMLATVDNFSMAESVKGLEAVLSAYNMRAKSAAEATAFAGRAVDIITKVSHTGQISAQDLVQGIEATGKAAQQAGISLSFLSSMIETGVRNTGKSGSEIGQAIKALTVGAHSKKAIQELQKFGISISKVGADGKKQLRPLQDVIMDIANALHNGDKNAEQLVMSLAGGRYQYSKLYSILSDREEIMRQWGEAINSNGFAQKQLEVQMNTINSKIKQIKASMEELIQKLMNSGAGSAIKGTLDLFNTGLRNLSSNIKLVEASLTTLAGVLSARFLGQALRRFSEIRNKFTSALSELKQVSPESAKGVYKDAAGQAASNAFAWATGKKEEKKVSEDLQQALKKEDTAKKSLIITDKAGNAVSTLVVNGAKAEKVASTGVAGAKAVETGAHNANTAAMLREAAVTTAATMGLNLVIGAIVAGIGSYALFTENVSEANKALTEQTGLTEKAADTKNTEVENLKQEISVRKEQLDYADKAVETARSLQAELDKYAKATSHTAEEEQKAGKAKDELRLIETNLSATFGASSANRIKESKWNSEAYMAERDNYVTATNDKEKKLQEISTGLHEYYAKKVDLLNKEKIQYETSMSNFGSWTTLQLKGLDMLDKAWVAYYNMRYTTARSEADSADKELANIQAQINESDGGPMYEVLKVRYATVKAERDSAIADMAEYKNSADEIYQQYIGKAQTETADALGKLKSFDGVGDDTTLYPATAPEGEWTDPPDKSKKGSGKGRHTKTSVGFGDITEQVYHNMALDGNVSGTVGFDENHLKALSQMINGEDSSNLFGLGDPDAMKAGLKAAELIREFGANGGMAGVLKHFFGDDSRLEELINNARWYADNLDWGKGGNEIFGAKNVSDVGGDIVADADAHIGEQWRGVDYGFDSNATWETQCASWVSYEMQKHGINSINSANGDVIMEQAGSAYHAGEAPVNAGDIINWANHVGIYDGNGGYVARNSKGGVQHGTMEEAAQYFGQVLGRVSFKELAEQNGVSLGESLPWVNSKAKATLWNWEYDPEKGKAAREQQDNAELEKRYQLDLKEAEIKKQLYGETADYFTAVRRLEEQRLVNIEHYNEEFKSHYQTAQDTFQEYIDNNANLQQVLKKEDISSFSDLTDEDQKELMKRIADNGSAHDKNMAKLLDYLISNKDKVRESDIAVGEQKAKVDRVHGSMTEKEAEDWIIQQENDKFELNKGPIENTWETSKHYKRLADVYQQRLERQQDELAKYRADSEADALKMEADIKNLSKVIKDEEEKAAELMALKNPTPEQSADLDRTNAQLEKRRQKLDEAKEAYDKLKNTSGQAEREMQKNITETQKYIKNYTDQANALSNSLITTVESGLTSTFSNMLLEGKSFKDGWKSLWKQIAQIAIQQLVRVFIMQKLLNLATNIAGHSSGVTRGEINIPDDAVGGVSLATGGRIPQFASGGSFVDGLIKGAGTGTSDSIFTYLAHRGQFIKTSDGEYIIKKSSVDKLGVPFLDMLNQNPDIVQKMKHYADGGSLGSEMIPTMKPSTVDSFTRYSTNQVVNGKNQNKKLEELMMKQNDLIASKGQDEKGGGIVVLNTHASSEDVMKAIKQNPRAVQAILGRQQRMGFR